MTLLLEKKLLSIHGSHVHSLVDINQSSRRKIQQDLEQDTKSLLGRRGTDGVIAPGAFISFTLMVATF